MDFQPLAQFLNQIPSYGAPGVDCIVKQGHYTIFRHHAGFSDLKAKKPMNGTERFFLYSSSKVITCVAALQLIERGVLALSDPLSAYFPEYAQMHVHTGTTTVLCKEQITIWHLFTMTAGFNYALDSPAILNTRRQTNMCVPTQALARALASQPLDFSPGSHWNYSLAHDILGAVIEVVSGKTLGQYLTDSIFTPLEMHQTSFQRNTAPVMPQYRRDPQSGIVSEIPTENAFIFGTQYESGGAGIISTVDDYSRFAAALANGGVGENGVVLLRPETIDLMRTNQLGPDQLNDFNWEQMVGYGYGLGVRTLLNPQVAETEAPIGEFGWSGAAGTYVLIDPSHNLSLFYAQHMLESLEPYVHPRLRNLLYTCLK